MDRARLLKTFCTLCLLLTGCHGQKQPADQKRIAWNGPKPISNVRSLGAVADGKTSNTAVFQSAIDQLPNRVGGEVVVPAGNYVVGSLVLKTGTTLHLEEGATLIGSPDVAEYPVVKVRWEGRMRDGHRALLYADHANAIAIIGSGKIIGDTKLAYLRPDKNGGGARGPTIFDAIECYGVRVEGITINYERMWSLHPLFCTNVSFDHVTIRSTPQPSNGDGIDVDSCKNVRITNCDIETGDDSIALKSGRGAEGVQIGRPTENVTISHCKLGSTFAGLAIGSEVSGGIRNIQFDHCEFTRGANAIFIKTNVARGGYMQDIHGADLTAHGVGNFLQIDLIKRGIIDDPSINASAGLSKVGNISLRNVKSDSKVFIDGSLVAADNPLTNFTLENIAATCQKPSTLKNVTDVHLNDISVTGASGPMWKIENVSGSGIEALMGVEPTSRQTSP